MLRHDWMTVAMVLAEMTHHSSRDRRLPGPGSGPTPQPELFSLYEEEPGGSRPDRLFDVRPQEAVQRHTVEQRRSQGAQLVEVFRHIDTVVPEQVIDVPKITSHDITTQRAALPVPQMVEQLSDVPLLATACGRWCWHGGVTLPAVNGGSAWVHKGLTGGWWAHGSPNRPLQVD